MAGQGLKQVLRKGQAIVWIPPRSIGERAFATEASLLVLLPREERAARFSFDALPRLRTVTLIFDARDVSLLDARLPSLSGARLHKAIPNIVEDQLLQDPQQCAFALGPRGSATRLVAAIDRSWLEFVLGSFERRAMKVQAAWPAQLTLALGEQGRAMLCAHDGLALRTGAESGFGWGAGATRDERAAAICESLELGGVRTTELADAEGQTPAAAEDAEGLVAAAQAIVPVQVEDETWREAVLFAQQKADFQARIEPLGVPVAAPLDLLSARRGNAAGRRLADVDWHAWRLPAALALIAVLVSLLGLNLHWGMLVRERDALRTAIETRYRDAFPQSQVIVDPVLQMERQVAGLRAAAGQSGPADFVPLLARFSQALTEQKSTALAGIDYRDGRLRLRFQPGQYDARAMRESLIQACERLGLQLRFDSEREPTATLALLH